MITIQNLSKQFDLGTIGTGTLAHDLNRFYKKLVTGKDPYLKIDQLANSGLSDGKHKLALHNINLKINEGDILGIVGKNGAGKSTLLKILSRIIAPTTGEVELRGRLSALLEVGTGFHPELTGRENVFLNGAILGMCKSEIRAKLNDIIEFSGVGTYIDTPVKRYSSGMLVRLGFAVAAFLESEILIIDEVLAVGDLEFQNKCIKQIKNSLSKTKTVLVVSHNLNNIADLCNRAVLLSNGTIQLDSSPVDVINTYVEETLKRSRKITREANYSLDASVLSIELKSLQEGTIITTFSEWSVEVVLQVNKPVEDFVIGMGIITATGVGVTTTWSKQLNLEPGVYIATFDNKKLFLAEGSFKLVIGTSIRDKSIEYVDEDFGLTIVNQKRNEEIRTQSSQIVLSSLEFDLRKI